MSKAFDVELAERYCLYIDETGSKFWKDDAASREHEGRMVGLLMAEPTAQRLRTSISPKFHATEESPAAIDRALDRLFQERVGVLGLRLGGSHVAAGDAWLAMVVEIAQWALRLAPIGKQGKVVRLVVLVEQRGNYRPEMDMRLLLAAIKEEFGRARPDRAASVMLESIAFATQEQDPCIGYVDALAHSFGSTRSDTIRRVRRFQLASMLIFDPRKSRELWDLVAIGDKAAIDDRSLPERVSDHLAQPDVAVAGSLAARVLGEIERHYRAKPRAWEALLDWTRRRLDGGDVNLAEVTRLVGFLDRTCPAGHTLGDRLDVQAVLRCARLEVANHRGDTDPQLLVDLDRLASELFEFNGDLACQIDLVRAVHFTNRFEFDAASAALARWQESPGRANLAHRGRVMSSLGQHLAFAGDVAGAIERFQQALELFDALRRVDPDRAERERLQTATYLALASLDDSRQSGDERKRAVVAVLGGLSVASVAGLAGNRQDAFKYRHHLLVRCLAQAGSPDLRAAYVGARGEWADAEGFPWPMINAWRAFMLWEAGDAEGARKKIFDAIEGCEAHGQGATMGILGVALRMAVSKWLPGMAPTDAVLEGWSRRLPAAASWLERKRREIMPEASFAARLLTLLPFNFR
jgi:hypothetical protein